MVGPGGGESCFPVLKKGSRRWIGKGDVEDVGAGGRVKWESGKSTRDIKEGIAEIRGPVEIGARDGDVLGGEFTKWIRKRVVEVEIPQGDGRESMKWEEVLRGEGA